MNIRSIAHVERAPDTKHFHNKMWEITCWNPKTLAPFFAKNLEAANMSTAQEFCITGVLFLCNTLSPWRDGTLGSFLS